MQDYRPERMGPVENDESQQGAFMREAVESDDPSPFLPSFGPLRSTELSSLPDLQISFSSLPSPPAIWWSRDVLSAFRSLPDFSPEQATVLIPLLRSPPNSPSLHVTDYLVAFLNQPDYCNRLRKLTQQLKSVARGDVVIAMHKERRALRWLGPILPEEHLVRDILPSLWEPLTTALSISHAAGYDWKWLAEQVHIPRYNIDLWKQTETKPADNVLRVWQVDVNEATVGRLFDLMIEHREDLAAML